MGSRWLDPSDVAKGPEMRTCTSSFCPQRCPYPSRNLVHGEGVALCAARWSYTYMTFPAVLPPSPLVAAPRWGGKPTRIADVKPSQAAYSIHNQSGPHAYWSGATYPRQARDHRPFKVRPFNPGNGAAWRAHWMVAL